MSQRDLPSSAQLDLMARVIASALARLGHDLKDPTVEAALEAAYAAEMLDMHDEDGS